MVAERDVLLESTITCPGCGTVRTERMPEHE